MLLAEGVQVFFIGVAVAGVLVFLVAMLVLGGGLAAAILFHGFVMAMFVVVLAAGRECRSGERDGCEKDGEKQVFAGVWLHGEPL
jgi:hypothetical protein